MDPSAESTRSAVLLYHRRLAALLVAPITNQQTVVLEQRPGARWRSQPPSPSVCGQKSLLAHRSCSDFTDSGCEILVSFHGSDLTAGPTRSSRCSTSVRNSQRLFCFCRSDCERSSSQVEAKIIGKWGDAARLNCGALLEGSCAAAHLFTSRSSQQLVRASPLLTADL